MRPRDVAQETGQPTAWQAKRRMFARRNCHAVDRNPVGADCFFEREQRGTSSTNERLQIVPRVSAGLSKKPHAGRVQQRIQHLPEVLSQKIIAGKPDVMTWAQLATSPFALMRPWPRHAQRFDVPISESPLKQS
jgi:hypothetical protein